MRKAGLVVVLLSSQTEEGRSVDQGRPRGKLLLLLVARRSHTIMD